MGPNDDDDMIQSAFDWLGDIIDKQVIEPTLHGVWWGLTEGARAVASVLPDPWPQATTFLTIVETTVPQFLIYLRLMDYWVNMPAVYLLISFALTVELSLLPYHVITTVRRSL